MIDFSLRDGRKRLEEIRRAVSAGTFDNWLELVFLPLYGRETGAVRSDIVERVIRFETDLYQAQKLTPTILAATLIMSNKLIDKARIKELWEEIKMLDVLEVAREKGIEEGKIIGIEEGKDLGIKEGKTLGIKEGKIIGIKEGKDLGKTEATRETLLDALLEKFNNMPIPRITQRIKAIEDYNTLRFLLRQVFRCEDMESFEAVLSRLEI